jgi:hypothetical protein
MLRKISATVVGVLAAFSCVLLVETIGHSIWPISLDDGKKMDLAALPVGALIFVLAGWVLAVFVGVALAAAIAKGQSPWPPRITSVLFLGACAFNLTAIAHPTWFLWLAALAMPITLVVAFTVIKRRDNAA